MTIKEFEDFLYTYRRNKREVDSLRKSYRDLDDKFLEAMSAGAMDYSKDRVQNSTPPDEMLIDAIERNNEARKRIMERIKTLESAMDEVRNVIDMMDDGITHEVLRLYFIEDRAMTAVSDRLVYSERRCWQLWRLGIRKLYENME